MKTPLVIIGAVLAAFVIFGAGAMTSLGGMMLAGSAVSFAAIGLVSVAAILLVLFAAYAIGAKVAGGKVRVDLYLKASAWILAATTLLSAAAGVMSVLSWHP